MILKKMPFTNFPKLATVAVCALFTPLAAQAIPITLGNASTRTATFDSATLGFTGSGNATVTEVDTYLPGMASWTERGSVAGGNGSSGIIIDPGLTVNVTSGSWGNKQAGGTWTINNAASFWNSYPNAAISIHVGNGGGEPDHFVWLIEQGQSNGTWSYDGSSLNGGGLSNLKLYSSGTVTKVPDGGFTVALLGLAIAGSGLLLRKLS